MQNFRNYYDILGTDPEVSVEEIKRSYRRLARRYHPDLNPGDKVAEEKFKALNEAYEVLSDEQKRSQYDQFSRYWQNNQGKRPGRGSRSSQDKEFNQYGGDFNRFVDDLLNRQSSSRGRTATQEGDRVRVKAKDSFRPGNTKTAYRVKANGTRVPVSRERPRDVEARLTLPFQKAYQGGRERIRLEDGRSLEVDMPPGMVDGQQIRLKGQGIDGGNLYLKISVSPHPVFELQGSDIYCKIPITPIEAILGGAVEVPTLDGLVKITVPQGVQSGKLLRLANKGYLKNEGRRGDQLVEIEIVFPSTLSDEERELYEKLQKISNFNPREILLQETS